MTAPTTVPAARRLVLSAVELAVLTEAVDVTLPPWFGVPEGSPDPAARAEAVAALRRRGVLADAAEDAGDGGDGDGDPTARPVAPVAANLATLARSRLTVDVEVSVRDRGSRSRYAVAGGLGASVFTLADGAVELSMFPAEALGRELVRAVPEERALVAAEDAISQALGGLAAAGAPPQGRLPLAALAEYGLAGRVGGGTGADLAAQRLRLSEAQRELAERVDRDTVGVLRCVVAGTAGGGLAVAQVIWLATAAGWTELHPAPAADGAREVVLRPVRRAQLPVSIAPSVAQLLEGVDR